MTIETHATMVQRLKSDDYEAIAKRMTASPENIDIDHAITGIFTEGAEMADAFKRYKYYGTELDEVNLKEEVGDLLWYTQLLCAALGTTIDEAMDVNEAKLKSRFGDKFSEDAAVNRDTDVERVILEEGTWITNTGEMPVAVGTLIDFIHRDGETYYNVPCGAGSAISWGLDIGPGTIVKWRLAQ